MSYSAVVARIHTRELPGADNLLIGACLGYQVIVGRDVDDGTLGVFFSAEDGQLSESFAAANDLVRRKDEQGNPAGGFFEPNRRVRAIKLRGARSEGFFCPLRMFAYTGADLSKLHEGQTFTELNGYQICNKYVTPKTAQAARDQLGQARRANRMFAKHVETEQFKRAGNLIPVGAACYVSAKLHGTSHRVGYVLDETPIQRGWLGRHVARWLGWPTTRRDWTVLNGTRNTVISQRTVDGFYGSDGFRLAATKGLALHRGEVVYGELVGYTETGQPIMSPQGTAKLSDKAVTRQFGPEMVYRYGQSVGESKFYVYRITQVNEDGCAVELSWQQMIGRCRELGLSSVPLIEQFFYDGDLDALTAKLSAFVDGETGQGWVPSRVDPRHIEEGVVLRYESEYGCGWQKIKSYCFGVLEGYLKENPDIIDREEAA